jgi:copper(I)-binding protein
VREPLGGATTAAAFAVIENAGPTARALVSVLADVSDAVELHEMKMVGDMMRMSPVKRVEVPAHGKAELKPGSFHVMIFELKRKLVAGDKVRLTFTFDDGTKVPVEATVRKPEALR